jgi:two-component system sensor histidine kinase TctE
LGLPIVLEIAHQHEASVSVDDAYPGRQPPGARFTVRFVRTMAMPPAGMEA